MYLVFITFALCAVYFVLLHLFPLFFAQKITLPRRKPWLSLICIVILSAVSSAVSISIPDLEFGNRILHIFGGAFAGFLVCFLAARDSRVSISKFQFFVFSVLIVLALSVANELLEFFLQEYDLIMSATTVDDTWLDLVSNMVGIIFASACFVPFYKGAELDHI